MDLKALMVDIGSYFNRKNIEVGTTEQRQQELKIAQTTEPIIDEMVDSSWIESGIYNEISHTLEIQLIDNGGYIYYNVSPQRGEQFFDAPSKGVFVNNILKKGFYPFSKIG